MNNDQNNNQMGGATNDPVPASNGAAPMMDSNANAQTNPQTDSMAMGSQPTQPMSGTGDMANTTPEPMQPGATMPAAPTAVDPMNAQPTQPVTVMPDPMAAAGQTASTEPMNTGTTEAMPGSTDQNGQGGATGGMPPASGVV